jgi:hypothetical protein
LCKEKKERDGEEKTNLILGRREKKFLKKKEDYLVFVFDFSISSTFLLNPVEESSTLAASNSFLNPLTGPS